MREGKKAKKVKTRMARHAPGAMTHTRSHLTTLSLMYKPGRKTGPARPRQDNEKNKKNRPCPANSATLGWAQKINSTRETAGLSASSVPIFRLHVLYLHLHPGRMACAVRPRKFPLWSSFLFTPLPTGPSPTRPGSRFPLFFGPIVSPPRTGRAPGMGGSGSVVGRRRKCGIPTTREGDTCFLIMSA